MTAQEYLKETSPNDKHGLRAKLQKHRLMRIGDVGSSTDYI